MKIDREDYELLKSALESYKEMMSDDEDDEQDNSTEIAVCKKYIKLLNKPVESTNEQPEFRELFKRELAKRYGHTPKLEHEFIEIHSRDIGDIIEVAHSLHKKLTKG